MTADSQVCMQTAHEARASQRRPYSEDPRVRIIPSNKNVLEAVMDHVNCLDQSVYKCAMMADNDHRGVFTVNQQQKFNYEGEVTEPVSKWSPLKSRYKSGDKVTFKCSARIGTKNNTFVWETRLPGEPFAAVIEESDTCIKIKQGEGFPFKFSQRSSLPTEGAKPKTVLPHLLPEITRLPDPPIDANRDSRDTDTTYNTARELEDDDDTPKKLICPYSSSQPRPTSSVYVSMSAVNFPETNGIGVGPIGDGEGRRVPGFERSMSVYSNSTAIAEAARSRANSADGGTVRAHNTYKKEIV
nr:hypothetical protein BaRGS_028597 [Batillaria attramentaria]